MKPFTTYQSAVRLGLTGAGLAPALTACTTSPEPPAGGQSAAPSSTSSAAPPSVSPTATGSAEGSGSASGPTSSAPPTASSSDTTQARAGTWPVADAGTVKFETQGGSLSLGSAEAKSGWKRRVSVDSAREIEVHFTKGDTDWKFEAEIDDDGLEISRERDTQPIDDGSYEVLEAATVAFTSSGRSLKLGKVTPADGWKETTRDISADDIEIDFTNGSATAEFEVEINRGQVKLELSQKVTGPAPR